jgi:DNA-directed RNA polymerase subunit L
MDIKFIKKEKNEIEFVIKKDDIAFYNLIEKIAVTNKDVEFVALKKADNLIDEFSFYIKTKNKSAKTILLDCISQTEKEFTTLINDLDKSTD